MRLYRRTLSAVLVSLWAAGTAFFIPSQLFADDSPVTSFTFSPSPFSLTQHTIAEFKVKLNDEYDMDIEIRIYTPAGELVHTILNPDTPQDEETPITWYGVNDRDQYVKPGGYYCKLLATPSAGGDNKYSKTLSIGVLP